MSHTPGLWFTRESRDGSGDIGITAVGLSGILAECFGAIRHRDERAIDEAAANARLITAAPQLLAAAKEVMAALEEHGGSIVPHLIDTDMNAGQRLRDAIAKAEAA